MNLEDRDRLAPRIDAGGILGQCAVALPPGLTASAAARALHLAGLPLLDEVLAALAAGTAQEQPAPLLPYCPFPPPALLRGLERRRDVAALHGVSRWTITRIRDAAADDTSAATRIP